MVLSTHIVEDVAVLCPRFAVIRAGRLVALTTPRQARETHRGRDLRGQCATRRAAGVAHAQRVVTQALLVEGRNRVRVYAPERPRARRASSASSRRSRTPTWC